MPESSPDFLSILKTLTEHRVDFIIVGGVAAVLQGAPVATFDLDLVHSRLPANLTRLLSTLDILDAHYRENPDKRIVPSASHLAGPGHHLLITRLGPLDLLGAVSKGRQYEDLLEHALEMEISPELKVRVLDLAMLIVLKEELRTEKDLAVLPLLRRALEERDRTEEPEGRR
jgi:predicted nucleotidyltransferase